MRLAVVIAEIAQNEATPPSTSESVYVAGDTVTGDTTIGDTTIGDTAIGDTAAGNNAAGAADPGRENKLK